MTLKFQDDLFTRIVGTYLHLHFVHTLLDFDKNLTKISRENSYKVLEMSVTKVSIFAVNYTIFP